MNLPILSTVQQQLAAVFEQWLTMMREALAATSKRRTPSDSPKGENCKRRPSLPDVERALRAKYHLRYNVLTGRTEYRAVDAADDAAYLPVTKRVYKTWLCELQAEGVDFWWMGGIEAVAESMHVEEYHPVTAWIDALPQWDGTDRLTPLMRRLTQDETLVGYLCRWMLAFVHQARGGDAVFANSVAPLLISDRQGLHKSTFCRLLLPGAFRYLYTDSFDLPDADDHAEHTTCL